MTTFGGLIGVKRLVYENGSARYFLPAKPELNNSWGITHGGVIMTLLDIALGGAAYSMIDENTQGVLTVELQTQFLSPGRGDLIADGRVMKAGKSIIFCAGEITLTNGSVIARANGIFKVQRRRNKVNVQDYLQSGW